MSQTVVTREGGPIRLHCKKCGREWSYRGKNPYFATCSFCKGSVSLRNGIIMT